MQFPVAYFDGNLLFARTREAWAIYELEPPAYNMLSVDERRIRLYQFARLFWHVDLEGHLLAIPVSHPIRDHYHALKDQVRRQRDATEWYCDQAADYLERLTSRSWNHRFFLAFKLSKPTDVWPTTWDFLKSIVLDLKRFTANLAVEDDGYEIFSYELRAYKGQEEQLYARLGDILKVSRVETGTTEWLLRTPFWRGLGHPPLRIGWQPRLHTEQIPDGRTVLRPQRAEMITLAEGDVDLRHPRRVAITQDVEGEERTSYQSYLAISEWPDEIRFPGSEWAYDLQTLHYPVAMSLRWTLQSHEQALAAVRNKKREISDQIRHAVESDEQPSLSLASANEQLLLLEEELKRHRYPTVQLSTLFCVYDSDPKACSEYRSDLRRWFRDRQMEVECPTGDQWRAFNEFLPGGSRGISDYVHRLLPDVVGSAMPGATFALGDLSGPYIGHNRFNKPVYLDPALPPQRDRSASIAFLGTLGSGKSYGANLITYLAVLLGGARALILDPKSERGHWPQKLPELTGRINVVTLSAKVEDDGKLDPFALARRRPDLAKWAGNMAITMLAFLVNAKQGKPEMNALMEAVDEVQRRGQLYMRAVVDVLLEAAEGSPEHHLGRYLDSLSHRAMANLIFGRGQAGAIDVTHDLTILQLENATFPQDGTAREDYTLDETISVALMHGVTAFAHHFIQHGTDFKVVLMDEAKVLFRSSQGRDLATRLVRTGRSKNNGVYLISQNADDLADGTVYNNLGCKFLFRSPSRDEVEKQLELLNLEPNPENIGIVQTLQSGEALFQDLYGRSGVIKIDAIFQHLHDAFNTRPQAAREEETA